MSVLDVELIVYRFRERAADTTHFNEVIDTCPHDTLQPAELPQQLAPLLRTKTRNLFKRRLPALLRPPLAVARDLSLIHI